MTVARQESMIDLYRLQEQVNRLFEEVAARSAGSGAVEARSAGAWRPALDLHEEGERYVLRADLPGVAATDIEIDVDADRLTLRGDRRPDAAVPREGYLRVERPTGRFAVQVALPSSVDRRAIRASQRDGVLEVVLPKSQTADTGRVRVEVR